MKKRIISVISVCLVCLTLFLLTAFASTAYQNYLVDVPKMNGSATTTNQIKTKTAYSGNINVTAVGGGKKLDCRMVDNDNGDKGAWLMNVTTGSNGVLYSRASHLQGHSMCVLFSNKLTTLVDVTTYGSWRADS